VAGRQRADEELLGLEAQRTAGSGQRDSVG